MTIESDLPEKGTASNEALDFNEGVSKLEDMLGDPYEDSDLEEIDSQNEPEAETDDANGGEVEEAEGNAENEDDDANGDEESETDEGEEGEALELSDDTEIDLGDGKRATLAQLKADYGHAEKRISDFQRDYTRKTTALSERENMYAQQEARLLDYAQQIAQQRDYVTRFLQANLPQPPQRPELSSTDDPQAWWEYTEAKDNYDRYMAGVNQFWEQSRQQTQYEQAQMQQAQQRQLRDIISQEQAKLVERHPEISDLKVAEKVWREAGEMFEKGYGLGPQEWGNVVDSRVMSFIIDATAWKKKADQFDSLQKTKPQVLSKVKSKPRMLQTGRAPTRNAAPSRKRDADARLRKEGSLEAGINALLEGFTDL